MARADGAAVASTWSGVNRTSATRAGIRSTIGKHAGRGTGSSVALIVGHHTRFARVRHVGGREVSGDRVV